MQMVKHKKTGVLLNLLKQETQVQHQNVQQKMNCLQTPKKHIGLGQGCWSSPQYVCVHTACISFWIPKRQAISTDTSFEIKMTMKIIQWHIFSSSFYLKTGVSRNGLSLGYSEWDTSSVNPHHQRVICGPGNVLCLQELLHFGSPTFPQSSEAWN